MSTAPREEYLDWLRDAHAMEKQAEQMLSATAGRIKNYPELKARLELHLEETRSQAARLEQLMARAGADTSALKDLAGRAAAAGQAFATAMASDEIVKATHAAYAFEHMEVASYQTLIAAADSLGEFEAAAIYKGILVEEQAMADWLIAALPKIVQQYLGSRASGEGESR
jgi:ferritin-like metal-binding protein YciE